MKIIIDVNRKKRDELLEYLLEKFNTVPYDDIDMEQVAQDNDLSYRELQCYFANKKRLFVGTYYHFANHLINHVDEVVGNDKRELMEMIRVMAGALNSYGRLYPRETRFMNLHRKIDSPEIEHEVKVINERHKDSLRYIIKTQVNFSQIENKIDKRKLIKEIVEDITHSSPEYMEEKWSKKLEEINNN